MSDVPSGAGTKRKGSRGAQQSSNTQPTPTSSKLALVLLGLKESSGEEEDGDGDGIVTQSNQRSNSHAPMSKVRLPFFFVYTFGYWRGLKD